MGTYRGKQNAWRKGNEWDEDNEITRKRWDQPYGCQQ